MFFGPWSSVHGNEFRKVNSSELTTALINQKENLVDGIRHAQDEIEGSFTVLILTSEGEIIAARDKLGRLSVLSDKNMDGYCDDIGRQFLAGKL